MRVATGASVGLHAVLLLSICLLGARSQTVTRVRPPIEITVQQAPPVVRTLPEVQVTARPQPKVKPPRPSALPGGGSPKGKAVRNPSPITPERPQSRRPASNAGGTHKAAFAPPHLLTSKAGKSPSGPVGKGSATAGPGGKEETAGEGPTFGPGIGGGPDPIYPKTALDQGLEGTVTLTITVGPNGEVLDVAVSASSGHASLDQAAVRAVKRWTFTPGLQKGKPAAGKIKVPFRFLNRAVTRE